MTTKGDLNAGHTTSADEHRRIILGDRGGGGGSLPLDLNRDLLAIANGAPHGTGWPRCSTGPPENNGLSLTAPHAARKTMRRSGWA